MSEQSRNDTTIELIRGLREGSVSRRDFILKGALLGLSLGSLGAVLSACGSGGSTTTTAAAPATTAGVATTVGAATTATTGAASKAAYLINMPQDTKNEYWQFWSRGAEDAAKQLGMKVDTIPYESDPNKQVATIEAAAAKGANCFITTAPSITPIKTLAKLANDRQMYYFGIWDNQPWFTVFDSGQYYAGYSIPDDFKDAYLSAKSLMDAMGGKGTLVFIAGWKGSSADQMRSMGFFAAAAEFPDIKVVGGDPGQWSRGPAEKIMRDYLVKYPKFEGVYNQNDDQGIGALKAVEESGRVAGKDVLFASVDGISETLKAIAQGKILNTVWVFAPFQTGFAVARLFDMIQGVAFDPAERFVHTGSVFIDKSNADKYLSAVYDAASLPWDFTLMSRFLHPDDWDYQNDVWPINPIDLWTKFPNDVPKPSGYTFPAEITAAADSGKFDEIAKLYASHYKKKWDGDYRKSVLEMTQGKEATPGSKEKL
ncbi:MAG: sugar ABC transporter substrate-binding protein [Actinobacteria bacterium]|nr:sugar ABC transporter substrate-binding protein [Actinomycetota bacterium]MCL5736600.1 sugar ABC transporter substrate-binding protein [Actinomycetota bacterium]